MNFREKFSTLLPISSIAWTTNEQSKYIFAGSWNNKVKKKIYIFSQGEFGENG
jgi:hypothetical protein